MDNKLLHQQKFLQKMALTPQMRQSLNILSMPVNDLAEFIDSALTKNPFLKKIISDNASQRYKKGAPAAADDSSYPYENTVKQDENPRFSILSQIKLSGLTDDALEIAEYLIFEMDDNGYIKVNTEDVAENLGVTAEEVAECLSLIKKLEPAGIGAEDISECLQLQLERKGMTDSLEYRIVSAFLSEVARDDIGKISKALNADTTKVKQAVNNIRKLNPRPASTMLAKESERVIPDLIVKADDKKVRFELNRGAVPGLKLYNPYENDFNIIKDPEARKFMKENINAAKGLIGNLKRREDTVCKVADYILRFQQDALNGGADKIKSLTIRNVADATDFHPSTISRAVSNKYIQVNDRVMPLSDLLSHGIIKENGEVRSKVSVKKRIEEIIRNEKSSCPVSDSVISEMLQIEGIRLSRRTVAKYRNSLRILPANLRKKSKRV